jgi:hypothetical protein
MKPYRPLFVAACLIATGPASAQDRTRQYLGLARATLDQPITPAELDAALLSPAGVQDIAALFQKALAAQVIGLQAGVTPEIGGEATLDRGRIRFVEYPDPLHPVLRRALELRSDPTALLDFLTSSVEGQQILATTGGLHAHLYQMTTKRPTDQQHRVLDGIMRSAVEVLYKTWTITPERQQAMIEKQDWRGRYVGFWHIHPPGMTAGGYVTGFEPSMEDMRIALEKGQFLTIVFQRDGFDVYDLEPLSTAGRPDLSKARVIRYRSPEWERRFPMPPVTRPQGAAILP